MNRGWRGGGRMGGSWERPPPRSLSIPPPLFGTGYGPRPPTFCPGARPPWRHPSPQASPLMRGRGGFAHRGVEKRFRGHLGSRGAGKNKNWNNQNKQRKPQMTPGQRLTEEQIGVTEYVSDHNGFTGVIKSRYADFQVSEINKKGEVAELTSQEVPQPPEEDVTEDEELLTKYNLELLPVETWDRINALAVDTTATAERVEVDVTGKSKEERTKIHDAVKKAFGESVVGSTVSTDDKKLIRFEKYRKGVRVDTRVKWLWGGEYVHFIVHKENCDTMDVAGKLAERLHVPSMKSSALGYAGTKDRRAKTSQWFSARRVQPARLAAAARDLGAVHVGNFTFSDTHLKLGMLRGNRIALRNVTAEDAAVGACCEQLATRGFINYYGLQRFGTRVETPTFAIGRKLLQGNYKEALSDILAPRPGSLELALTTYARAGAAAACAVLRKHAAKSPVGRLLHALARDPNDLVGALAMLPRNTLLLYLHSYQSLVWNRCVSRRLQRLGRRPAPGDLVLCRPEDSLVELIEQSQGDESEDEEANGDSEKLENGENTDEKESSESDEQTTGGGGGWAGGGVAVRVLDEADVASGRYELADVVLPLPGHSVRYPPNLEADYHELLAADGLSTHLRNKIKTYSLSGAYRQVLVRPEQLTWSTARYSDPAGDLILSDWDKLQGRSLAAVVPDGKYKALLLDMRLPASCYATMALRELLRVDTAGDTQAALNNYHQDGAAAGVEAAGGEEEAAGGEDEAAGGEDAAAGGEDVAAGGEDVAAGKRAAEEGGGGEAKRTKTE